MKNNLLILGTGGHGRVVKEVADAMNNYNRIDFLDDNSDDAIGKCDEFEKFRNDYTHAFVAFGNSDLRAKWFKKLEVAGYNIPTLIHPTAYVSPSAVVQLGVIVLPKAVINTNSIIKQGTIIGIGSLIDHNSIINDFCHINTGSIVKSNCTVNSYTKIAIGEVYSVKQLNQEYSFEVGV